MKRKTLFLLCNIGCIASSIKYQNKPRFKKNVRLGGRFHTLVLDNTIKLPYLRTTPGTQINKRVRKDTIFKDREPQKPYPILRHVPI